MRFLEKQTKFKTFEPTIIISVQEKRMLALNKEGQIENILISKLKNSIRPRINENRKDSKLKIF